jgi:hypothetical protein
MKLSHTKKTVLWHLRVKSHGDHWSFLYHVSSCSPIYICTQWTTQQEIKHLPRFVTMNLLLIIIIVLKIFVCNFHLIPHKKCWNDKLAYIFFSVITWSLIHWWWNLWIVIGSRTKKFFLCKYQKNIKCLYWISQFLNV